jgi:hypothetical protein
MPFPISIQYLKKKKFTVIIATISAYNNYLIRQFIRQEWHAVKGEFDPFTACQKEVLRFPRVWSKNPLLGIFINVWKKKKITCNNDSLNKFSPWNAGMYQTYFQVATWFNPNQSKYHVKLSTMKPQKTLEQIKVQ